MNQTEGRVVSDSPPVEPVGVSQAETTRALALIELEVVRLQATPPDPPAPIGTAATALPQA